MPCHERVTTDEGGEPLRKSHQRDRQRRDREEEEGRCARAALFPGMEGRKLMASLAIRAEEEEEEEESLSQGHFTLFGHVLAQSQLTSATPGTTKYSNTAFWLQYPIPLSKYNHRG